MTPRLSAGALNFVRVMLLVLSVTMATWLVFMLCRFTLALWVFDLDTTQFFEDTLLGLFTASRFDVAVSLRANLCSVLLVLACWPFCQQTGGPTRIVWLAARVWAVAIFFVSVGLSVINIAYIRFFGRPFDSFLFHGLDYGTDRTIGSILGLDDFLPGLAVIFMVGALGSWGLILSFTIIERKTRNLRLTKGLLFTATALSLMLYLALGRGAVTTFPLSQKHLVISSQPEVNYLVPNGVVAAYYAYQDFRRSKRFTFASDAKGRELFEKFYGVEPRAGDLFPQFFTRSPKSETLEANPPNVVLNLVESLGQGLLLDRFNQGAPLADGLASHLKEDFYVDHFLPAHNDTQRSVLGLLVNTEHRNISYSSHQYTELQTSAASVFKRSGYRTIFVYAGFEGIKNRADYFKRQGFDLFIGARQLKQRYPNMPMTVWGGHDQYVYDYVIELLKQQSSEDLPLFIVTLSVTNHPPFELPKDAKTGIVDQHTALTSILGALPSTSMDTFRYTNQHLGRLLDTVKGGDQSDSTIVAITGDHAVRGLKYSANEALHRISVPLYFYIPPPLRRNLSAPSTPLTASHKDIMPTLYHLALSEADYPNLGRNLFSEAGQIKPHDFAYNSQYLIVDDHAYRLGQSGVPLHAWKRQGLDMIPISAEAMPEAASRGADYQAILDWLTRYQLVGSGES